MLLRMTRTRAHTYAHTEKHRLRLAPREDLEVRLLLYRWPQGELLGGRCDKDTAASKQ